MILFHVLQLCPFTCTPHSEDLVTLRFDEKLQANPQRQPLIKRLVEAAIRKIKRKAEVSLAPPEWNLENHTFSHSNA